MKRITSFFIALLFMFNIAMIPTRAEHATTMHTHDTVQVHENHSKASYFVFQKGTEISPRRAPACGACLTAMYSRQVRSATYVGTVPCHLGSTQHQDNKYEVRVYTRWQCPNCGQWIDTTYYVERTIIECPE